MTEQPRKPESQAPEPGGGTASAANDTTAGGGGELARLVPYHNYWRLIMTKPDIEVSLRNPAAA